MVDQYRAPKTPHFRGDVVSYIRHLDRYLNRVAFEMERRSDILDIPTKNQYVTASGTVTVGTASSTDAVLVELIDDLTNKGILR